MTLKNLTEAENAIAEHEAKYHKEKSSRFIPPDPQEVTNYAASIGFKLDGQSFVDHYEANGWIRGKTKMKDWKAAVRTWKHNKAETVVDSQICIVCRKDGFRKQLDAKGKYKWLCENCFNGMNGQNWGWKKLAELERIIEHNKAKGQTRAITKFEEPEEYYE